MTETEKAYIAGIIDGKGSIMLQILNKGKSPSPCVSIDSTTLKLLEWIKEVFGAGRIIHKKNYNPEVHKECYSYVLKFDNAIDMLKQIYTYLIIGVKKERARLIIMDYKNVTPRNGRYNEEMLRIKKEFYNRFMKLK